MTGPAARLAAVCKIDMIHMYIEAIQFLYHTVHIEVHAFDAHTVIHRNASQEANAD